MISEIIDSKPQVLPIEINQEGTSLKDKAQVASNLGVQPLVYYQGMLIPHNDLNKLEIYNTEFVPKLSMRFTDQTGIIKDRGFPVDNSIISIFIKSTRDDVLKPIRMDFKITNFNPSIDHNGGIHFDIDGVVNLDFLWLQEQKSFNNHTSFDVFKNIAQTNGLGFQSNIQSTNDSMTQINYGLSQLDQMKNTSQQVYVSEESFTQAYIDLYYNLYLVDIETQLRLSADTTKGIVNHGGYKKHFTNKKTSEEDEPEQLMLTNKSTLSNSENFFSDHQIYFSSTEVSLDNGYKKYIYMYDNKGNQNEGRSGGFYRFLSDSITTPGKETTSITLKSNPMNPEFFKKHITQEWVGKIDTTNAHRNLNYIKAQNNQNLKDLEKIVVRITLPNVNFNLYRFQKILVEFSNNDTNNIAGKMYNESLTGEQLITTISYIQDFKKSGLRQEVTLVKRELEVVKPINKNDKDTELSNNR